MPRSFLGLQPLQRTESGQRPGGAGGESEEQQAAGLGQEPQPGELHPSAGKPGGAAPAVTRWVLPEPRSRGGRHGYGEDARRGALPRVTRPRVAAALWDTSTSRPPGAAAAPRGTQSAAPPPCPSAVGEMGRPESPTRGSDPLQPRAPLPHPPKKKKNKSARCMQMTPRAKCKGALKGERAPLGREV